MSDIWFNLSAGCSSSSRVYQLTCISSFRGPTATAFLEWVTPSSLSSLPPYSSTLSVILNEKGGIIDDTVVTKHANDAFYVVTNAGRRDRDLSHFKQKLEEWNTSDRAKDGKVELEVLDGWGLIALQGLMVSLKICFDDFDFVGQDPSQRNICKPLHLSISEN